MKYKMKKIKKYQATRRLRKESEYKEPLSSPVPRTRKNLEASMASRFFCCLERAFCSTFVPLCLFLSKIDRERCRETGTCFRLSSLEGVGVDVQCGRRLRVAKCGRDGAHVGVIGDEQRGIEMPKLMDAVPRQAVTFAKLFSPVIEIPRTRQRSVELGKKPTALMPLIAQLQPFHCLLCT